MSEFNPQSIVTRLFRRIRQRFDLGMREYLAALDAVNGGQADNMDELKRVLKLLWCHSLAEQGYFDLSWNAVVTQSSSSPSLLPDRTQVESQSDLSEHSPTPPLPPLPIPQGSSPPPLQETPRLVPLAVRSPLTFPDEAEPTELQTYWPVSRRSMAYTWRYLRRPAADGPADVLDLPATLDQVTHQGFFLAPVYRRREVNHAHLMLLIDQDGSMTPFHRFTRDLVDTAKNESDLLEDRVEVYYFHNLPGATVYNNAQLTLPTPFDQVLVNCDSDTSLLIVSDAGAARGYRRIERIRSTTEFLVQLRQHTNLLGWLNPMPTPRWENTSAEVIARLAPMETMDADGFSNAIDIVRGQPLPHLHRW